MGIISINLLKYIYNLQGQSSILNSYRFGEKEMLRYGERESIITNYTPLPSICMNPQKMPPLIQYVRQVRIPHKDAIIEATNGLQLSSDDDKKNVLMKNKVVKKEELRMYSDTNIYNQNDVTVKICDRLKITN